jgi:hypothetical protein
MRAQSGERQIGLPPPSTTLACWIAFATDSSCPQVCGTFWCAVPSMPVLISIASGDQSFGKP